MHYIKDLFENKETEHLHNKFIRYSKGNFCGPLMKIRISKANVKIGASFHYVDELLKFVAEILGDVQVHVKGTLIWNSDLGPELAKLGIKYSKVTKSRGIFKYLLENDVPIKTFVETMGNYHVLINIKQEDLSYVTKSSFPKPNKEFGPDFCKVTFPISILDRILEEFAFDVKSAKKLIEIKHSLDITEIKLPEGEEDFEIARKLARRIGHIKREVIVDSESTITEKDFNV